MAKQSKAWKNLERDSANFHGVERNTKKHYGDSIPDVLDEKNGFVIECKHTGKLPQYLFEYLIDGRMAAELGEIPVVEISSDKTSKSVCLFWHTDLFKISHSDLKVIYKSRAVLPSLANNALIQADNYKTGFTAIAVLKEKNMRGRFAFMWAANFWEYVRGSDDGK